MEKPPARSALTIPVPARAARINTGRESPFIGSAEVLLLLFAAAPAYSTKVIGIVMRAVRGILEPLHMPLVLSAIVD